jgi:hypothetical protein
VAQLADLATPEMGATTGLRREDAARQLAEKGQNLITSQLLA